MLTPGTVMGARNTGGSKAALALGEHCLNEKRQAMSTHMMKDKANQNVIRHTKNKQRNTEEMRMVSAETEHRPRKRRKKPRRSFGEGQLAALSQSTGAPSLEG